MDKLDDKEKAVRCGRCGNENKDANRFCGMCGAPLLANSQAGAPPDRPRPTPTTGAELPRQSVVPAQLVSAQSVPTQPVPKQTPVVTATAARNSAPAPAPYSEPSHSDASRRETSGSSIAGPSFLGLDAGGYSARGSRRAYSDHDSDPAGGHDSMHRPSENLDYLLEDGEDPERGRGKWILGLVALALALGFGYLRFKQGGFDWLSAGDKKTTATAPAQEATRENTDSAKSTGAGGSTDSAAPQAGAGTSPSAAPALTGGEATNAANPAQAPPQSDSQPGSSASTPSTTTPIPTAAPPTSPKDSSATAEPDAETASAESENQPAAAEAPAAPKARAAKPSAAKPAAAKPAAARPFDSVAEAERYIYGRGVRQDCDHGLQVLKPAAQQADPKAMISLGTLYSTGTCTPHDLPTAYRWFALALHKQPDNQALQDDLQKLWSRMTPPERQLAIRLSQ